MEIAVTGASGFVGRAVCSALIERGCAVAVLSRSGDHVPGVRLVRGDIHDPSVLADLLGGVAAVVHAAGLVRSMDSSALRRANVEALITLLEASESVDRFVHVSTAGVHGLPGGILDESAPFAPANPYEASKVEAERQLQRRRPSGAVVVRPTNILGVGHPHDPLVRFFGAVRRGRVWTWRGAWSNYVGSDAVAAAIVAAATDPDPPGTVLVNSATPVTDLAALAASLLDTPDRCHLLPSTVAGLARRPVTIAARHVGPLYRVASVIDSTRFHTRHEPWLDAVGAALPVAPTLAAMIADYRHRGLL